VRLLVESACKRRGCSFRPLAPRSSCFAMIVCFARVPCCRLAQREKHHPNTRISLCFVVLHSTRGYAQMNPLGPSPTTGPHGHYTCENMHMQQQARRAGSKQCKRQLNCSLNTHHAPTNPQPLARSQRRAYPAFPCPRHPPSLHPVAHNARICGARCSCVDALPRCCGPPPSRRVLDELSVLQRPPRRPDRRCPSSSSSLSSHHDASESRSTAWSQ
jgi:hypothetical protein